MNSINKICHLVLVWLCCYQASAQLLVHPDSYLIPNNYDFWEFGDVWLEKSDVKSNGDIIVYAWEETAIGQYDYGIYYKILDRWGNLIHDTDVIEQVVDSIIWGRPSIAFISPFEFIISWTSEALGNPNDNMYYQRFDLAGIKIGVPIKATLNNNTPHQSGESIAFPTGNYGFVVHDNLYNTQSPYKDYWIQTQDNNHIANGSYTYLGRHLQDRHWTSQMIVNDTTVLISRYIKDTIPPYANQIVSIRVNDKGQKLDSIWFKWDITNMDSLYTDWGIYFLKGKVYAATIKKSPFPNTYGDVVISKFNLNPNYVLTTSQPSPSIIFQDTSWFKLSDDTIPAPIGRGKPVIGFLNDLNKFVISWIDNRNAIGCLSCLQMFTQYIDTSLMPMGGNFLSASQSIAQSVWNQYDNQLFATKDFFVQTWMGEASLPIPHDKLWTNIYSASSVYIEENAIAENILLFPNPARNQITVSRAGSSSTMWLSLRNVLGQEVFNTLFIQEVDIDVSKYPKGVYMLHLTDKATVKKVVRKVVLQD